MYRTELRLITRGVSLNYLTYGFRLLFGILIFAENRACAKKQTEAAQSLHHSNVYTISVICLSQSYKFVIFNEALQNENVDY